MTEFQAEGLLTITGLDGNSVTNIEKELSGIGMSASPSGGGGVTAVSSDKGTDILSDQLDTLNDIEDVLDKSAVSGGGVGGGGGVLSTVTGGGFGLTDILGVTSFGKLVSKVSLRSLLTKIPTFSALLGGGILVSEFISGDLGREDIIQTPIKVGEIITGGLVKNDLITGTIGVTALTGGAIQIGSFIKGTLSASALSGYLGSISIGGVLSSLAAGGSAAAGAVTLAGLLGTTAIGTVISDDSTIDPANHVLKMEFGEALVDAGRANVAVVDYITPAPLDAFIAEKTDTSKADNTVSTGSDFNPYDRVPDFVSPSDVNGDKGPQETQEALESRGWDDIGTPQDEVFTSEDRFRRSTNRARQRQNRQELDINVNGNLTLDQAQSAGLIPEGEIPPEARRKILDLVERELLGSRI